MTDLRDAHIDEALQEWIDGRLAPSERQAVEEHLSTCLRCRRLKDSLEQARQALRAADAGHPEAVPPELRARILAALDAEDQSQPAGPEVVPIAARRRRARFAWAAAAALLVAAAALWLILPGLLEDRPADPVAAVEAEHERLARGERTVEIASADPAALERAFAARLPFEPRVLDLGMMGFELAGGLVGRVGQEPSAVMVYRPTGEGAPGEDLLLCQMYRGRLADLPPADAVEQRGAFTFHIFQRGATTLVFWQEGDLVCVLAGDGGRAAILDLAAAKAMLAVS